MQVLHVHMQWNWTNKQLTVICICEGGMGSKSTVTLTGTVSVLLKKRNLTVFLIEKLMVVVLHTLLENNAPAVMSKQTGVTQVSTMQIFNGMFPI